MKKLPAVITIYLAFQVLPAHAAGSEPGPSAYFNIIDRHLNLGAEQQARVQALLGKTLTALLPLTAQQAERGARLKSLTNGVYGELRGLLDGEHQRALDPSAAVYNLDTDFLPPIGQEAQWRGRAIIRESEPQSRQIVGELQEIDRQQEALWNGLFRELHGILDKTQQGRFDALKAEIDRMRSARRIHDQMTFLADNPTVLGEALDRVRLVAAARREIIQPWMLAWQRKEWIPFERLLAPGLRSSSWSEFVPRRSDSVAQEYSWSTSQQLNRDQALRSMRKFLGQYGTIEGCDIEVFGVSEKKSTQVFMGYLSVRGVSRTHGRRMESTAAIRLTVGSRGQGSAIEGIELLNGKRVIAARPVLFENRTAEAGLLNVPVYLRTEAIRRGGYALAINSSHAGPSEIYAGTVKGGLLLRQDGLGQFSDVTPESGLGYDPLVKSALFADFNNSGKDGLLINHFQDSPAQAVVLYEGLGNGKFRRAETFNFSRIAENLYTYPMPMAVGDFNGDQKLDLHVGFPGTMDFTTMPFEQGPAAVGVPQGLFLNEGDFKFRDRTKYALYNKGNQAGTDYYPHSSVAADLNKDGRTDIIVVDDRKNPSTIYLNKGRASFEEVAKDIGVWHAHWGMSAAIGDYDNQGSQDIYMTNVNFPSSFVMENYSGWLLGEPGAGFNTLGNHLYRNRGDGTFEDVTDNAGVRFAGAAPGGAVFFDFDNDGRQDLYVVNGLWSAGPRAKSFDDTFLLASLAERNMIVLERLFGVAGFFSQRRLWLFACYDDCPAPPQAALGEGKGEKNAVMKVLQNVLDEDGKPAFSLGANQRNRLFHNNGDGTFTDVAYVAGLDTKADGYVAATADFDHDGALDLVLRNGDPGTEAYQFPPVELFMNSLGGQGNHLAISLKGVKSNRNAIGAKVTVERAGGPAQYRELIANNGAAQDAKLIHFGLNRDPLASKVVVGWPSGLVQTFPNVEAGNYDLVEGGALTRVDASLSSTPGESVQFGHARR